MDQIVWLQNSAFATWIRESSWAIFTWLILHTLAMGFLVGTGLAVDARVLGVGRRIPLPALTRVLSVMGWALGLAIVSGVLLVIGYPAKALTNPLFYVKLTALTVALLITLQLDRRLFQAGRIEAPSWAKAAAALSIVLWIAGVTLGRFLAYTHKVLLAYPP
jgi:hypothetical protein